jgi:hypothetical protein
MHEIAILRAVLDAITLAPFLMIDDFDGDYDCGYPKEDDYRSFSHNDHLREGCCFPGDCCMPGRHFTDECHTAEMMEDIEAEHLVPEAVDYLISRGFTAEDFQREFKKRRAGAGINSRINRPQAKFNMH